MLFTLGQGSQRFAVTRRAGKVIDSCLALTHSLIVHGSTFRYNGSALTPVFITRVFQECLTYNGEMDYKSYLDFVLALENRNSAQGLRYLFQIMDIDNKGYLHPGDLNFFYRVGAHGYRRRVTC